MDHDDWRSHSEPRALDGYAELLIVDEADRLKPPPWSSYTTNTKAIKRSRYGRAKLDLLRRSSAARNRPTSPSVGASRAVSTTSLVMVFRLLILRMRAIWSVPEAGSHHRSASLPPRPSRDHQR
jgi:hypothetical protein